MKKHILPSLFVLGLALSSPALAQSEAKTDNQPIATKSVLGRQAQRQSMLKRAEIDANSWAAQYNKAKQEFTNATGISYTLDASYLGQRGAPNGKITPWQNMYYGTANWDMFNSDDFGSGSVQAAYTMIRYWNKNGSILGNNIGVVTGVNDFGEKANYFDQLSYTHKMPGKMDWMSVTLGQFPMYNFDGTSYDSNQQINFVGEAFSQNLTQTYPSASLGGYMTVSPSSLWSVSAGMQDATNLSGDRISTSHWGEKKFTSFLSAAYNPTNALGDATISFLVYNQPSVETHPEKINGWSFNAQQNLGKKWAIFGRVNGVSKGVNGVSQSYVVGGVYNNPLNRNPLDQIGLAAGINKLDTKYLNSNARAVENVMEAYWAWGVSSFMTITPDVQFFINPGENRKSNTATVASIRATLMF